MSFRLRRAEAGDADEVKALVLAAYAHYPDAIGLTPRPMLADYGEEIATKEVVVAEGDEIAGVLVLRIEPDHVFVDNVAVSPGHQGEGIGGALLARAEERAAELEVPEARLLTNELMTDNLAMYEHLGWQEYERREHPGYSLVFFRKPVSK